jgi:hypothetical protein
MAQKKVYLNAKVYLADKEEFSPNRNIRDVHVIYLADIAENPNLKVVVFKGEMWDYKTFKWVDVYGELCLVLKEGQNLTPPVYIPFDDLANVDWSTNRYSPLFTIGMRDL